MSRTISQEDGINIMTVLLLLVRFGRKENNSSVSLFLKHGRSRS